MKCFILLAAVVAICLAQASAENIDEEWSKYKVDHDRVYNAEEDAVRKQIFVTKWEAVKAHNKLYEEGKVSYSTGINQFSDRKPEELKHLTGGIRRPSN